MTTTDSTHKRKYPDFEGTPKVKKERSNDSTDNGHGETPTGEKRPASTYKKNDKHTGDKHDKHNNKDSTKKPYNKNYGKPGSDTAPTKALTRQDRKSLRRERRAARPHAETIEQFGKIWKVNVSSLSKEVREQKMAEILAEVSTKIRDVCTKHDASRALQVLIKNGSDAQREIVHGELKGMYSDVITNHYGHYIALKMLQWGSVKIKHEMYTELVGQFEKLSLQADASKVVDYMYASIVDQHIKNNILQEFFNVEYSVLKDQAYANKTMDELFVEYPKKKEAMMAYLKKFLIKCVEKKMMMFRFVHALMISFLRYCTKQETDDIIVAMHEMVPQLHHSPDGCRILTHVLSHGTAKDRKHLVKGFKGTVLNMAERLDGHQVLIRALDVTDDTVLLDKFIVSELVPAIPTLAVHPTASKVLLHILAPRNPAYSSPREIAQLDVTLQDALLVGRVTSKKDPIVKQAEILAVLLAPLLEHASTNVHAMLTNQHASKILTETIRVANSKLYANAPNMPGALTKQLSTIAPLFESTLAELAHLANDITTSEDGKTPPPLQDREGHYVYKRLLLNMEPANESYVQQLIDAMPAGVLLEHAQSNRGSFVLCALLETPFPELTKLVRKILIPHTKTLIAASAQPTIPQAKGGKPKNKPVVSDRPTGKPGIEILIRMLKGETTEGAKSKTLNTQEELEKASSHTTKSNGKNTTVKSTASPIVKSTPTPAATAEKRKSSKVKQETTVAVVKEEAETEEAPLKKQKKHSKKHKSEE